MADSRLGDYLHACRGRVRPEDVGLSRVARRRVSGLRREEVATLAGVSADYYVRLEQGRERNPSAQVLNALAEALLLDEDGRLHLFRLAGLTPRAGGALPARRVDPALLQLMDGWPNNPALVLNHTYDVLARNRLGRALFSEFGYSDNLLLNMFLDPAARTFYAHWHTAAVNTVAGYRLAVGAVPDDPRVNRLVADLRRDSPEFADMWARNDARGKTADVKTFRHREVGELTLRMQTFDIRSSPGQQLVVYHAEQGSPSAQALALLGAVAATLDREAAESAHS
jgi:transcriptional regulator with XRE-family HTH domain